MQTPGSSKVKSSRSNYIYSNRLIYNIFRACAEEASIKRYIIDVSKSTKPVIMLTGIPLFSVNNIWMQAGNNGICCSTKQKSFRSLKKGKRMSPVLFF